MAGRYIKKGGSVVKTIAKMEAERKREREVYRNLVHWTGLSYILKKCRNCHFMPTNQENDLCAKMDKQVREPEWNWDCPGWEWRDADATPVSGINIGKGVVQL